MLSEHIFNLVIFVLLLGSLILVHELGHFLAARLLGVKVNEFGLGLPPRARKLGQWRGTEFTLNWIPLGGFIRPEGEHDPNAPGGLAASAPWKRLAILSAGSAANLLLGGALLVAAFTSGWPEQVRVVEVVPGSPAQSARILPDDMIVQVNGETAQSPSALANTLSANDGIPTQLTLRRGEEILSTTLIPDTAWSPDGRPTGMTLTFGLVRLPLHAAVGRAWERVLMQMQETLSLPWRLAHREVDADQVRLISPIGLKQVSDRVVQNSLRWNEWFPVLSLTATISVALGIANLLPIPALDGGHILFVLVEIACRRRVNERLERWVRAAGLLALFGLTAALAVQDITRPIF